MCGINGFYNYADRSIDSQDQLIQLMNKELVHRGPDDMGQWHNDRRAITLGHRRLSILDLSPRGHQPMHGREGATIVFNGEIYNFRDLKKQFDPDSFNSESDTEVMLRLYEKKGLSFLNDLNGMFAFGLWDESEGKLMLARDRVGIKPLYYSMLGGVFSFSSEIRSLLKLPWINAAMDERSLYYYLTFNKVSHPDTMFEGIKKFHPGYRMVVGSGGIERYEPYWDVEYTDYSQYTDDDLQSAIYGTLRTAVQRRMVSDVPVGAFLSGGVDSSAVVGLMSEFTSNPVKTYSIGFEDAPGYDELAYASAVSRQFGTDHHEKIVTRNDIVDFLPQVVDIFDEPLADATSIPIYFISELARENGSIVVLTGDGADEEFLGYRGWQSYLKWSPYYRVLQSMPGIVSRCAASISGMANANSTLHEILSRAANGQELFWGGAGAIKESAKHALLSEKYLERMCTTDIHSGIEKLRGQFDSLNRGHGKNSIADWMSYVGIKEIMPNYYLYRADRLGMAHSIELRVPFLDHEVVNLALSIPGDRKLPGGEPKGILKKSLEGLLTKETLYRKKAGFCVPLDLWLGDIVADSVETQMVNFCQDTGLLDVKGVKALIKRYRRGGANTTHSLWNIFFLMNWHRRWIH